MGYVFISYNQMHRTEADNVRTLFLARGIQCWMAPYSVAYSKNYGGEIIRGIRGCDCFLLLLTNASQQSVAVDKEVERAISYRKPILALQLEDLVLNDNFEYYLSNCQIAFPTKLNEEDATFRDVLRMIREFCGTDPIVAPTASKAPEKVQPTAFMSETEHGTASLELGKAADFSPKSVSSDDEARERVDAGTDSNDDEDAEAIYQKAECYRYGKNALQSDVLAVAFYEQAAELDHALACYQLGCCYADGECGLDIDDEKAREYLEKAASLGFADAWYMMAIGYRYGSLEGGEPEMFECLKKGYRAGSALAAYGLGDLYLFGTYVKEHECLAVLYFLWAAEQGCAQAQSQLGYCYENGYGFADKNVERAAYWYEKAAAQGDKEAAKSLEELRSELDRIKEKRAEAEPYYRQGVDLIENGDLKDVSAIDQILEQLEKAGELGCGAAYYAACDLLLSETEGDENQEAELLSTLIEALEEGAKLGDVDCAAVLGSSYLQGKGVEEDYEKALTYLLAAADQGHDVAQFLLAGCCYVGYGLPEKDEAFAVFWMKKAAAAGNEDAANALKDIENGL